MAQWQAGYCKDNGNAISGSIESGEFVSSWLVVNFLTKTHLHTRNQSRERR
jgi:hypothetical protein